MSRGDEELHSLLMLFTGIPYSTPFGKRNSLLRVTMNQLQNMLLNLSITTFFIADSINPYPLSIKCL